MNAPIVTVNADFTDGAKVGLENVRANLPGSVITFVQESKRIRLREKLPHLLGVRQGTEPDKANSSLIWDKSRVHLIDHTQTLAVDAHPGVEMLPRWLKRIDCRIDDRLLVSAIVGHRPPPRYRWLWPEFDQAVAAEIQFAPFPTIVGLDTNSHTPAMLARSLGLRWSGRGIDGFMYDRRLHVSRARRMKATRSDHRAVLAFLETR